MAASIADIDDVSDQIPIAALALPSIAPSTRRLPPPCWTAEETSALIEAYKDKWYSLRRGNLRANHWQEVADDVASRCPVTPAKTPVQCRHKMEKLRKRYRTEIHRTAARGGVRRYSSAWAHFPNMYAMERGPDRSPAPTPSPPSSSDDELEDRNNHHAVKRINNLYNQSNQRGYFGNQFPPETAAAPGFRIRIPGGAPAAKVYSKFEEIVQNPNYPNPNPRFPNSIPSGYGIAPSKVFTEGFLPRGEMGKRAIDNSTKKKAGSAAGEVAAAIQAMGEGFMRIEKVKMDMARQIEEMRMEMELKRTEMVLDSQRRIVEVFTNAVSERNAKKAKRMPASPHSWNQV